MAVKQLGATPAGATDAATKGYVDGYVQSRGTDLVTNGTAFLANNTNFSMLTYDPLDAPPGTRGSFDRVGASTILSDEYIPVDASKRYGLTAWVKQKNPALTGTRAYFGFAPFDAQGYSITPTYYSYYPNSTTTLAAPLNPGATTVELTEAHAEWFIAGTIYVTVWNWTDPAGRLWPVHTYSRNSLSASSVSGTTVTLSSPYSGAPMPAGTPVSRGRPGSTYVYAWNGNMPTEWTNVGKVVGGVHNSPVASTSGFAHGTAVIRIMMLTTYQNIGVIPGETSIQSFAGISMSDAAAAQVTADAALAGLSGKADTVHDHAGARAFDGGAIPATALPNSFNVGITVGTVDGSAGYPTTLGVVTTVFQNIERSYQTCVQKEGSRFWVRGAANNVWQPWVEYASTSHDHDDRYYTEAEVNDLLAGKITAFADPNADRLVFWDDSASAFAALTPSTGLVVSGTNMTVRAASETVTGIVELATNAEALAGTDTTRAVTSANVKAVLTGTAASETAPGLIELATSDEVVAGTDAVRAVTPAGLKAQTDDLLGGARIAESAFYARGATVTDLNAVVTPGLYVTAYGAANSPYGGPATVEVFRAPNTMQRLTTAETVPQVWVRVFEGQSIWRAWERVSNNYGTLIDATTNLNTITKPGIYHPPTPPGTPVTAAMNWPMDGANGVLEVTSGGGGYWAVQRFTTPIGDVYLRTATTGTWTSWDAVSGRLEAASVTQGTGPLNSGQIYTWSPTLTIPRAGIYSVSFYGSFNGTNPGTTRAYAEIVTTGHVAVQSNGSYRFPMWGESSVAGSVEIPFAGAGTATTRCMQTWSTGSIGWQARIMATRRGPLPAAWS